VITVHRSFADMLAPRSCAPTPRSDAPRGARTARRRIPALAEERELEAAVSRTIRRMRVLWISVVDEPGHQSQRASVERNAVALLSNWRKQVLDPPSAHWLGHHCRNERVQRSGLWNHDQVDATYEDGFLDDLERVIDHLP